jgi:hypothetical protein
MPSHVIECNEKEYPCWFQPLGCRAVIKGKTMTRHLVECSQVEISCDSKYLGCDHLWKRGFVLVDNTSEQHETSPCKCRENDKRHKPN